MEEMSKKTKRLEKENLNLTRKHDQTNRNILEMAEERTRDKDELEKLHKKETQMRSIIQSMREQGRVPAQELGAEFDEEGTESDYDEEYEDEEEDGSYDEDELLATGETATTKPPYGAEPPSASAEPTDSKANGMSNPTINGVKR